MNNHAVLKVLEALTGAAIIVAVWFGVYYGSIYYSKDHHIGTIITKGNELMQENAYTDAIACYDEALELEPENDELKEAISHAYILLGSSLGNTDEAVEAFRQAIVYDSGNKTAYWGIYNIYDGRNDEDAVIEILSQGYAATQDANMQTIVDNIYIERARIQAEEEERLREEAEQAAIEAAHNDLLSQLYACFEAGNIDDVKEMVRQEAFIDMTDEIVNPDTSYYYGEKSDDGSRNGKGVAAYMDGYYYYGDFADNERCGNGTWIRAVYSESSAMGSSIYEGEWSGDKPNGSGTVTSNYFAERVGAGGMKKQVISGNYQNGLENGTMTLNGTLKTGGSVKYQYQASDGIAAKISDEDSGVKGQYIIAKSADESSNLTSDGSKRGVEGFVNE